MKGVFEKYLLALRKTRLEEKTEHTDRAALEALLQTIADEVDIAIGVQHEPKREADKGAPDFKVTKGGLILGYVENKGIDENLNKVLKSEQIKKYLRTSSSPTISILSGSTNIATRSVTRSFGAPHPSLRALKPEGKHSLALHRGETLRLA